MGKTYDCISDDQEGDQRGRRGLQLTAPLYDARFEHDACGIGFVADLSGRATHKILDDGLKCLERLAHRGALDADGKSGDGAGVLCSIPTTMINRELERVGQQAHRPGDIAVGMLFLPRDTTQNIRAREIIIAELEKRGLPILMWRTVVHEPNVLGKRALESAQGIFFQPIFEGHYPAYLMEWLGPVAPEIQPGELETIHQPLDFLGGRRRDLLLAVRVLAQAQRNFVEHGEIGARLDESDHPCDQAVEILD